MKLYNTLSRKIEDVEPLAPPKVGIYTCGPTVYDYPHVGNWFTFIREDILVRTLKLSGFQPDWVMNITDVGHLVSDADEGEDKLEKGARREGKTAWDIAKVYTDYFVDGMQRLGMLVPDHLPKATDHIAEQIELIQKLEEKGFTYKTSDGIYYDTARFPRYADFARLDIDEQQAGKRVEFNPEKRNATDFALWKFSPADRRRDMEWDSPWGEGFPGWHIECSAMSMKYLGATLDIHAGGIDHLPVHHTNEIAQSEAATGQQFARHWMHSNHITIEGEKVSKSLGNGITLEDIEAKGISLEAFRLHVLESHYRSQSKFSWESLRAAQNRLNDIYAWADLRHQASTDAMSAELDRRFKTMREEVLAALQDDLNTPVALAALSSLMNYMADIPIPGVEGEHTGGTLDFLEEALGLPLGSRPDITDGQKALIAERDKARQAQDWTRSDQLRDELAAHGLGVRDKPFGAQWYRL